MDQRCPSPTPPIISRSSAFAGAPDSRDRHQSQAAVPPWNHQEPHSRRRRRPGRPTMPPDDVSHRVFGPNGPMPSPGRLQVYGNIRLDLRDGTEDTGDHPWSSGRCCPKQSTNFRKTGIFNQRQSIPLAETGAALYFVAFESGTNSSAFWTFLARSAERTKRHRQAELAGRGIIASGHV